MKTAIITLMPWHIGIDEAGYGPNLGPFVMTLTACRVPEEHADANLWKVLRPAVRKPSHREDNRLLIGDSKEVYSRAKGLADLETSVLASFDLDLPSLKHLIEHLCPQHLEELREEFWFVGDTSLPLAAETEAFEGARQRWSKRNDKLGCRFGFIRSTIVCARRFNSLIDRWESKGSVLAIGFADLMRLCVAQTESAPMSIVVDKHGGRNFYADMLQHAFPEGSVLGREEGMARSVYDIVGLAHPIRVTFMPRADGANLCVALASMVSKYVRELLMAEFNRYWLAKIPGIKPTAGYPSDATRFFDEVAPHLSRLGIEREHLWRKR